MIGPDSSVSRQRFFKFISPSWALLSKKIIGIAIGTSSGPSLPSVFMNHLEKCYLVNCPSEFKPELYRRYVDDTYCLFRDRSYITMFLQYINCQHPNINLELKLSQENSLPFLDVLVTHDGSNFSTSLYRKKTFTGRYTEFPSLADDKFKKNLKSVLVCRAFHTCSSYQNFHIEIVQIKEILVKNSFPRALKDCIIKSFLDKRFAPRRPAPPEAKTFVFLRHI